jgi:hypothetical protein
MPEVTTDAPAPACFHLHFASGIEQNQSLAPDLFAFSARDRGGRFAQGHSGNPQGRPPGIPNPKRRDLTLEAYRRNPQACNALFKRQPRLLRRLLAQFLPPVSAQDPAERIGIRIQSVRTPKQVWRAPDAVLQAAARGEITAAEAARIMRRIERARRARPREETAR